MILDTSNLALHNDVNAHLCKWKEAVAALPQARGKDWEWEEGGTWWHIRG